MADSINRLWWDNLDEYWNRYFKIQINKNFEFDRKGREEFIPTDAEINILLKKESLDVYFTSINNLSTLSDFKNLNEIVFTGANSLKTLEGIDKLIFLNTLKINQSKITSISLLKDLPKLKKLSLSDSPINSLDDLPNLANLKDLAISELPIENLIGISKISQLEKLFISSVNFNDFNIFAELKNLKSLEFFKQTINNINFIKHLQNIQELKITYSEFDSLMIIPELNKLSDVDFSNTSLKNIASLKNWSNLSVLNIIDTQLTKLSFLDFNSKISKLFITESNFSITDLLRFKKSHPNCKIYDKWGVNFHFHSFETYQVIKDYNFSEDEGDIKNKITKAGSLLNFINYNPCGRDEPPIYTFQNTKSKEFIIWRMIELTNEEFQSIFKVVEKQQ